MVPAAVIGPAAAAAVWLAASPFPWLRRLLGGAAAAAALGAGWAVFWLAFRGEAPGWGGLSPTLLAASLGAFAATAALPVVPRAEALPPRAAAPAVVGLGVGLSAVIHAAFTGSFVSLAVLLPLPTMAAAAAALAGRRPVDARGVIGLAGADVAALAGIAWLVVEGGSTLVAPLGMGPGVWLLLAGAAAKAGAIPGVAAWRLAATEGPGAPTVFAVRAQGVVLAVLAGMIVAEASTVDVQVWAAGLLVLLSGAGALWGRSGASVAAAAAGIGAGLLFLALGLGGAVGVRAALLLFPPFLLAAGAVAGVQSRHPTSEPLRPLWRWLGAIGLAAGAFSLLGLPPFGGFPGAWMALSLAWVRGEAIPVALAAALGIGLGAIGAVGLVRGVRPRPVAVVVAMASALALVYMGTQPIRLGIGWMLRIERELALPEILPTAGAPTLPPIGGMDVLMAGAPAAVLVLAVLVTGRGLRDIERPFRPLLPAPAVRAPAWAEPVLIPMRSATRATATSWYGAAAILEGAALVLVGWILLRGIGLGFL